MTGIVDVALYAAQSDLADAGVETTWTVFWDFIAYSLAHMALGMLACLLMVFRDWPRALFVLLFAGILTKEVFGDVAMSGHAVFVMLDSLWDLACYLIGFFAVWGIVGMHEEVAR